MEDMEQALSAIRALQTTSGAKKKREIIVENKDNESFQKLLYYSCHPRISYKLSEETVRKRWAFKPDVEPAFADIFEVCETLSKRRALDNDMIYQVCSFLDLEKIENRELYRKILSKTLRLGVTAKSINKAIPGLIPEWEVQQAYAIEKYPLKDGVWFSVSEKLNGVRATYYRGKLYARSGIEFSGLEHITRILDEYGVVVFDGELTLKDKSGKSDNEAFRIATGIVNSDTVDKSPICFTVFDVLTDTEFERGESRAGYKERREQLDRFAKLVDGNENVRVLPALYSGTDQSVIDQLLERMVEEDKEGLMVNLDVPYKCKRHNGILKVKRFYTMDLPVLRCKEGKGENEGTLGSLIVDYKGNEVGVPGFTKEEKDWFWSHRDEVAGMIIEVKYKDITKDKKTGAESLQFPEFVCIRADKDEASYD